MAHSGPTESVDTPSGNFPSVQVYNWKWYACIWTLHGVLSLLSRVIIMEKAKWKPLKLLLTTSNIGQDTSQSLYNIPGKECDEDLLPPLRHKNSRPHLYWVHHWPQKELAGSWRASVDYLPQGQPRSSPEGNCWTDWCSFCNRYHDHKYVVYGHWPGQCILFNPIEKRVETVCIHVKQHYLLRVCLCAMLMLLLCHNTVQRDLDYQAIQRISPLPWMTMLIR